jgi:hypothetical protein
MTSKRRLPVPPSASRPAADRRLPAQDASGFTAVLLFAAALGACAPSVAPLPAPATAPEPVGAAPVRPAPAPAAARVTLATSHPTVRYTVRSETTLRADSAGIPREASTTATAFVALALDRLPVVGSGSAGLRARGEVSQYVVTASERLRDPMRPATGLPLTVVFEAQVDGGLARVAPVPALANECDRPETAAAALARELLVRVPTALATGDRWTDTTRTFACRAGLPITVVTTIEALAESVTASTATIRRTLRARAEGEVVTPWRTTGVEGQGTTTETVELAVPSGEVVRLEARGESTFRLRDSALPGGGVARVVQTTVYEARRQ